jgi:hypothetical protein
MTPGFLESHRKSYTIVHHAAFDETIFRLLADGTCVDILGSALLGLPNLKRVYISSPSPDDGLKAAYIEQRKARWTITMKTLLSIVFQKPHLCRYSQSYMTIETYDSQLILLFLNMLAYT